MDAMPEGDAKVPDTQAPASASGFGRGFLTDIWYFAALSSELKPGALARYEILGQPVMLGRSRDGTLTALRDICPHRAAPLSAGRFVREADGAESVECPYHGWRFGADGACRAIPSLTDADSLDPGRIRVRRYRVIESQGMVFVWMSDDPRSSEIPPPPPVFPGVVGGAPKLVDRIEFDAHIDHAVIRPTDHTFIANGGGARGPQCTKSPNASNRRRRASPWCGTPHRRTPGPTPC
jgi:phenylpropionate dioxygenase-like ring-hydroxylating dioxygenase large terminal subunit